MKRAELIIGSAYFMSDSNNWADKHSGGESYYETARRNRWRKVIIVETQLKTDYDKKYRTRYVLIKNYEGKEKWVSLAHIRQEWKPAIKVMCDDYRRQYRPLDGGRGYKYKRHLERKQLKEQFQPALKTMLVEIKRVTGEHVSSWDKFESLDIKTIQILTQAISGIKTELTAVAS
jgi:hypothetical protein